MIALTRKPDGALSEAKRRMLVVQSEVNEVIRILTAEAAIKAQKVVLEAGRDR